MDDKRIKRPVAIQPHRKGCTCEYCLGADKQGDKAPPPGSTWGRMAGAALEGGGENPRVSVALQDGAVVVSGEYTASGNREAFTGLLRQGLADLAGRFNDMDAIIGHIKASVDCHEVEVLSVTEREVSRIKGAAGEFTVHLAAIVFAVDTETAAALVREMLEDIDEKVRTRI